MRIYGKLGASVTAILAGVVIIASAGSVFAASTPTFTATGTGDGDSVQLNVSGADANAGVILDYTKTNVGPALSFVGTTNSSGSLTQTISSSSYGIASGAAAYVTVDGAPSSTITWPTLTTSGTFSLSQTSVALSVGQSTTISAFNASGSIYLSNNSNPAAANISISGAQITITANTFGSTTATLCMVGNTSSCASLYITVGNGTTQALTFSISTVTVAPGQSVPITISGGTGTYTVLNNSNSGIIQTNINGNIITLSTNSSSGTSSITVCSSDMSTCGVINATAGSASTASITFSQTNPNLSIGQQLNIGISGGSSNTYYVSANSSSSVVQASVNGSLLQLIGESSGSSTVTVCSSSGSCASMLVTIGYTSTGGALALSQSTVSLLVGQVLSVTVSGASTPYSIVNNSGSIVQTSLNGNILTLSGIATGSTTVNICSAGGSCLPLDVLVNNSGAGSGITFAPSSVSVGLNASTSVSISGNGGYYLSNSTNGAIASVQISGSIATITGLQLGSENVSICESGGQCAILFVSVGSSTNTNAPTLSQSNPSLSVGQTQTITVSGATGSYYVSANSNPSIVAVSLVGGSLTVFGQANGSSTVTVCASGGSCSNLTVNVGTGTTSPTSGSTITFSTSVLPVAVINQYYNQIVSATGGTNNYTFSVSSGSLPPGLTLSANGLLVGTPTSTGSYPFTVTATDTAGNVGSQSFAMQSDTTTTTTGTPPPANTGSSLPVSGTLIRDTTGTYYLIINGSKEGVTNPGILQTYGYTFAEATPATSDQLTQATTGNLSPADGSLVKTADDPTVYLVSNGQRYGFTSLSAFTTLGYSFNSVRIVTDPELDVLPVGIPLQAVVTAHVKGTNVLSGGTIYYTDGTTLYPYPSLASYNSWNLPGDFTTVVAANSADLALPVGSPMGTRS